MSNTRSRSGKAVVDTEEEEDTDDPLEEEGTSDETAVSALVSALKAFAHAAPAPAVPPTLIQTPQPLQTLEAITKALADEARKFSPRDRREAVSLHSILTSLTAFTGKSQHVKHATTVAAERANLLLIARSHGWPYADTVQTYQQDVAAGIPTQPPQPPRQSAHGPARSTATSQGRPGRDRRRGRTGGETSGKSGSGGQGK